MTTRPSTRLALACQAFMLLVVILAGAFMGAL